jgi:cell shape-determining protein MreC
MTGSPAPAAVEELEQLKQENLMLRSQIEHVREYLLFEDRIAQQIERMKSLTAKSLQEPKLKEWVLRKNQELCAHLDLFMQAVPAQVVFREPCSWSSSVWINVGEKQNRALGKQVVAKNSPVLVGATIVGVIEYVGDSSSRVRLVTDSRLTSAVRAVRGGEQNRYLLEHLDPLLFALEVREDLKGLASQLAQVRQMLDPEAKENYLAKGELSGASRPLWRTRGQVLRGIGFNYDFADQEGPARDLRSGFPYEKGRAQEATSLLKLGDLLVTTGLDGVFPAGFRVAIVSKVQRLKEGASSYEIEAVSTAGNLDELNEVFVLPPLNFSR